MKYSKQNARETIQARLNALPDSIYAAAAAIVSKNVVTWLANAQATRTIKNVLLYQAQSRWREMNISSLEQEFPDITFEYAPSKAGVALPSKKYDAIMVPLYGFNDENYRLGHGGGWYDKFLATQHDAVKVGIGLEMNRVEFTPEPHDIPMDVCISEHALGRLL